MRPFELTAILFCLPLPYAMAYGASHGRRRRPVVAERGDPDPLAERGGGRGYSWSNASLAETDDRGVYRIYGLPAGRYTVSVGGPGEGARLRTAGGGRAYSRTFHPDVTDEARAKVIEVAAGTEAADKVRSLQVIAGRGGCKPRIRLSSCLHYAKIPQQRFLRMRHQHRA